MPPPPRGFGGGGGPVGGGKDKAGGGGPAPPPPGVWVRGEHRSVGAPPPGLGRIVGVMHNF